MRTIEFGVMAIDAAVDEKQTPIFCSLVVRDPGARTAVGRAAT